MSSPYVKVTELHDGSFCVVTYTPQQWKNVYKMAGRWFCKSYGEAMLQAQLWAARGFELREPNLRRERAQ